MATHVYTQEHGRKVLAQMAASVCAHRRRKKTRRALHCMIGDYKVKAGESRRAVKYSLSTTNWAPNGLCGHQECKTETTVRRRVARVRAYVCVGVCGWVGWLVGGGRYLPRFFYLFFSPPSLFYMCV